MAARADANMLGSWAWTVVLAFLLSGCGVVGPWGPDDTPPSPTIDPLVAVADTRRSLGLATDPGILRALAEDRAAVDRARDAGYDFPLTEAEVRLLEARARDTGEVSMAVRLYGADHPEAWAGSYLDPRLGLVIARFTGDRSMHETALASIVHRDARLRVESAEWTLVELEAVADRAWADRAWFATVAAHLTGTGVDIVGNAALLDVESDRADTVELVQARFGGPGKVEVRLSPAPWTGNRGTLVVRVRDTQGRPVSGLECELVPDDPQASVDWAFVTDEQGSCTFGQAPAMGVTVVLTSDLVDPPAEVARVRATVRPNAVVEVAARIDLEP